MRGEFCNCEVIVEANKYEEASERFKQGDGILNIIANPIV